MIYQMNPVLPFDGATAAAEDVPRLRSQLDAVRNVLLAGEWMTLRQLAGSCGGSQAGISARLRDLRKPKFGGYHVARRRDPEAPVGSGIWQYRIILDRPANQGGKPLRFGPSECAAAYEALRGSWRHIPTEHRPALAALGKWLGSQT